MFGGSTIDETSEHLVDDVFLLTYSQDTIVSCIVLLFIFIMCYYYYYNYIKYFIIIIIIIM